MWIPETRERELNVGLQIQRSEARCCRWIQQQAEPHLRVPCPPPSSLFQQQLPVTKAPFSPRFMAWCIGKMSKSLKKRYNCDLSFRVVQTWKVTQAHSTELWVPSSVWVSCFWRKMCALSPLHSPHRRNESAWALKCWQHAGTQRSSWDQAWWPNKLSFEKRQWDEWNYHLMIIVWPKSRRLNHTPGNQGR